MRFVRNVPHTLSYKIQAQRQLVVYVRLYDFICCTAATSDAVFRILCNRPLVCVCACPRNTVRGRTLGRTVGLDGAQRAGL